VGRFLSVWGPAHHTVPLQSEVRVYPPLFTERKNLAALFFKKSRGVRLHATAFGKGRDFERWREYTPGWLRRQFIGGDRATGQARSPRCFKLRDEEVYVIVDASRLSGPGRQSRFRRDPTLDRSAIVTAALCGACGRAAGRSVSGCSPSRTSGKLRARQNAASRSKPIACRDALYKPLNRKSFTRISTSSAPSFRLRLRRRALLVFFLFFDSASRPGHRRESCVRTSN